MAKPYGPDSGSGMQVNLNFEDESGAGVFGGPGGDAILANVIGGMQSMQAGTMAIFAPNLNAFRRFEPDQFTPVTSDWGEDNRSVAFRSPQPAAPPAALSTASRARMQTRIWSWPQFWRRRIMGSRTS